MTYPTYQEAKIANPDQDIFRRLGEFKSADSPFLANENWDICNPADYCMTVSYFHNSGYNLAYGDLILGQDWSVVKVSNENNYNHPFEGDDKRYVLKAKALEETKTYRYEKVDSFSFALEADFNAGILFRPNEFAGEGYLKCETEDDVAYAAANEMLYRCIEVTERELFIEEVSNLFDRFCAWKGIESVDGLDRDFFGYLFDSGIHYQRTRKKRLSLYLRN